MRESQDMSRWTVAVHQQPLMTLADKVKPEHTAVLVVDMQNDFVADNGVMARDGANMDYARDLAARLPEFLNDARAAGVLVVFIKNVYTTANNRYLPDTWLEMASRRYRGTAYLIEDVCRENSWEGDFFEGCGPEPNDPVVVKHRFSGFHNTELQTVLRAFNIRTVVMTGLATNVCVESTARDAFMRDYYVVMPRDGVATYSQEAHEASLYNIDSFFGEVVDIAAIRSVWAVDAPADSVPAATAEVSTPASVAVG